MLRDKTTRQNAFPSGISCSALKLVLLYRHSFYMTDFNFDMQELLGKQLK